MPPSCLIVRKYVRYLILTFEMDRKINRVYLLPKMDTWTKFKYGRLRVARVIDSVTLTFDPATPYSIWFFCYPGWMCGLSFRRASQCVIELLIGNEKVPYERTDMSKAIAYTLSSSMGRAYICVC